MTSTDSTPGARSRLPQVRHRPAPAGPPSVPVTERRDTDFVIDCAVYVDGRRQSPVAYDEALRESYAGAWQGLTHEEIRARFGEQYDAWKRGEPVRRGGGELESEVADRAAPVVERAAEKIPEGGLLVVVSHGGTIRTTIGRLLGLPQGSWEALGGLANCRWSVLGQSVRGWRLL